MSGYGGPRPFKRRASKVKGDPELPVLYLTSARHPLEHDTMVHFFTTATLDADGISVLPGSGSSPNRERRGSGAGEGLFGRRGSLGGGYGRRGSLASMAPSIDSGRFSRSDSMGTTASYGGVLASTIGSTMGSDSDGTRSTSSYHPIAHGRHQSSVTVQTVPQRYLAVLDLPDKYLSQAEKPQVRPREELDKELSLILKASKIKSMQLSQASLETLHDEGSEGAQLQRSMLKGYTGPADVAPLLGSLLCSKRVPFFYVLPEGKLSELGANAKVTTTTHAGGGVNNQGNRSQQQKTTTNPGAKAESGSAFSAESLICHVLAGGLGFYIPQSEYSPYLGALSLKLEQLRERLDEIRSSEDDPFGLNAATSPVGSPIIGRKGGVSSSAGLVATVSSKHKAKPGTLVSKIKNYRGETVELCARMWWALLKAHPLSQDGPQITWDDFDHPAFQVRKEHLMKMQSYRVALSTTQATAGDEAVDDFNAQPVRTLISGWIKQRVAQTVGYVGDKVGVAMLYDPNWAYEKRPGFGTEMREVHFSQLKKDVVYLKGSAVGLIPDPVRKARREWELCVQTNPVMFRFKAQGTSLEAAVGKLCRYVKCGTGDLRLISQKSEGWATILRSLQWLPGDKVLLCSITHDVTLLAQCTHLSARYGVDVSTHSFQSLITLQRALETLRPAVLICSHITELGRVLPIESIAAVCFQLGCSLAVDGSDAIGNIDVNVARCGADFYLASLSGYSMCYNGIGVLVVNRRRQVNMQTLSVSYYLGEGYHQEWTYTGLADAALWLSARNATQFLKYVANGHKGYCRALAREAQLYLCQLWGVKPLQDTAVVRHGILSVPLPHRLLEVDHLQKSSAARQNQEQPSAGPGSTGAGTPTTGRVDALFMETLLAEYGIHVQVISIPEGENTATGQDNPYDHEDYVLGLRDQANQEHLHRGGGLAVRLTCSIYNDTPDYHKLGETVLALCQSKAPQRKR